MAQLRDTVVSGSLRATDTLYSTTAQFQILRAPTTSNGTTYGPGSANNLLKSNGTSIYWTTLAASDIPNLSTDKLNSGTLGVTRGGTGVTSIANIQAGKDGDGNTISSTYLKLSGGDLTGNLGIIFGETDKFLNFWYSTNKTAGGSWRLGALGSGSSDTNYFVIQSGTSTTSATTWNNAIRIGQNTYDIAVGGNLYPLTNNAKTLGTSSYKWSNVYATTFTGDLTGNVTGNVSGTAANVTGTIAVDHGGTGATTAAAARTNLLTATGNARIFYGTCDTAAATVDKVVTCTTYDALTVGDLLVVKFTNTNSGAVGSLTLNVNEKGAKAVKKLYNGAINNLTGVGELNKDTLCLFMYNGTQWVLINGDWNSTYSYMMPYCSTAAGTAAKTSSIWKFQLTAGKYFPIAMYYDNTVQGAITLNINSTGAKPIYINGAASSASNYTLPAGIYIVYYNGTNYYFRTDNGIQGGTWFGTASTASALTNFKVTTTSNSNIESTTNTIGYLSGLTKANWNYQQTDGVVYAQFYNDSWKHQIFGDYRTGQISIRGKNNGTWTDWRRVLDETNGATILGLGSWAYKSSGTGSDVGLGNVENTKLSTWAGTSNIKTVGTITSGTWNGTAIASSYIGNHSTDKLTSGTLPVARGGTGQTSIAGIKTAINYGVTGQEVSINSGANNTNQNLQLCWTVVNSNSNLDNKNLVLVVSSSSISLYNSTDSTSVWTALSNKNLVTVAQGGTGTATAASNTVFAGPSSGSAAAPSFRALTTNDIPSLAASKITSGTFDTARIPTNISITGSAGISTVGTRIRTELTKGTNPSETTWQSAWYNYQTGTGIEISDRVGGGIESYVNSSGLSAICLRAYKYAANSTETNSLEIQIAKDGTLSYGLQAAPFRKALGLGDSSGNFPITVAQGGTGATTFTSGAALIGAGTGAVTTRSITNNTSATAVTASTNLITANTLYYHKGNSNITTVGTITSGTWQGTAIAATYIGNHSTDKLTSGTLPAARGGTGETTLKDAANALINALDTGSSNLTSNDYVITQYVGGGTTTTTYHRRPASAIRVGGLLTAREIYVNLSTTRDANNKVTFDGSADKAIHVSGTLPIARGGTGSSTAAANTVFAGPSSGSTTAPSFRALTTSDIPNLAASKITSGVFDAARIPTDINISGIVIKNTNLVKGTNPSAETWQTLWLNYQNENEENIQDRVGGNIQSKVTTTGSTVTYIRAYQFTANSTVSNNFGVGIAKDGTMSYEISDPAKFRAALGLGSNATSSTAYLPLSSGTLDSYYLNIKPTSTGSSPWITFTFGNNTTSSNGYSTYNNYHTYQGDWNIMLFANRYELNNAWSGARMFFRSYSAKVNSGERLNFYEEYRLPMASDGLSANAPYNILTTKNFNFFIKTVTKTPYNGNVDLEISYDYYVLSIYNSTYSSSTRYIWVPFTPDDNYSTWWAHGMKNDSTHAVPTGSQTLTILYMKCTTY